MQIKIETTEEVFAKAQAKLSPSQIAMAMRMALNDGVRKGRTMVRKEIQTRYAFSASLLNDKKEAVGLSLKMATNRDLTAKINAGNTPISLSNANPKFKGIAVGYRLRQDKKKGTVSKGKAFKRSVGQVSVEVIRGKRLPLRSVFTVGKALNVKSGNVAFTSALFARGKKEKGKAKFTFGKDRYPIDTLSTVSIGTAALNKETLAKYEGPVSEYAQSRFLHHVERLIKAVDEQGNKQ